METLIKLGSGAGGGGGGAAAAGAAGDGGGDAAADTKKAARWSKNWMLTGWPNMWTMILWEWDQIGAPNFHVK